MNKKRKYIIYSIILLLVVSLSVGFSAFQKQLLIDDSVFHVRLHEDVRVSDIKVQTASENVVSNYEDFNVSKLYGSVNFPSANSYILYKLDLSNYGNLKSGLFSITNNESGTSVQLCNSNGGNCTSNFKTPICNGNDCTLGATKEIYLKVSSSSSGNKMIDIDFDFEPYNTITYTNFREDTSSFQSEIMSHDTYQLTLTSKPEEVSIVGDVAYTYNKNTGVINITDVNSNIDIQARYLLSELAQTSYTGSDPNNYVLLGSELYRIITKVEGYNEDDELETLTKITRDSSIGNYDFPSGIDYMNDDYYSSLTNSQKELLEMLWYEIKYYTDNDHNYNGSNGHIETFFMYIDENDFETSSSWLNKNQFTHTQDPENIVISSKKEKYSVGLLDKTIKDYSAKKMQSNYEYRYLAINNNELVSTSTSTVLPVYPSVYLTYATIVTGGSGTRANPYILSKSSNTILNNPTQVIAKDLKATGSSQNLVTIKNQLGTVYFSEDYLDETNYLTGSTTIPTGAAVGSYQFFYYIPAIEGYKPKDGYIDMKIEGLYYRVNYEKEEDVYSIGNEWGSCVTAGTSLTCDVILPSISDANGATVIGWSDGTNIFAPGSSYTLSSSGTTLTARVNLIHNYLNVTTNKYSQTLKGALNTTESNETIKVLDNVTETQQATLKASKTGVKFDINGKTLNINVDEAITINGGIDFYNSSSTEGKMIFGVSSLNTKIVCEGKVTFNKTISSNTITFQASNSQATRSHNLIGVWSSGTLEVYDNVNIINTGVYSVAISSSGTVIIEGGNISAQYKGILNRGPLTIGKKDSNVSITSPSIIATGSSGSYGIDSNNPTFNFYDGIVKSNSGSGKAISGTISELPDNYHMHKETINGTESAYLLKDGYLMTAVNGNATTNYLRTNIAKQDIETITFTNSISGHTANGTTCFDVSRDEDGTVLAWVSDSDSDGLYEITIGADNKVYASSGDYLFRYLPNLTSINGLQYLDTSKATSMRAMFSYSTSLTSLDLSTFDTSQVTQMSNMFYECNNLASLNLSSFNTSKVTSMTGMFYECSSLTSLNLSSFNTSNVTAMNTMFRKCSSLTNLDLSNFNTANVTNMSYMFYKCSSLTSLNLSSFNTSSVANMTYMFRECSSLTNLDLSNFNTANVINMSYMFSDCISLITLNLSSFNTLNVRNMSWMFASSVDNVEMNLTQIIGIENFNTSKVTAMNSMFQLCSNLTSLDLSGWNTSNVDNMQYMFYGCSSLTTLKVSNFDTSKVTDMKSMFYNCALLTELDVSSFSTPLVTDMSYMFNRLWAIRTIYASDNFVTTSVTDSTYMFLHDEYLVGGSGTTFGGSGKSNAVYAHIDGGEANPGYFTDKNALKATFYYNSNTTAGSLTVSTKIATCVPAEGQTSCTVTIPNSVTSSVGKYNSPYKGVSSSTSSMSTTSNLTINSNTTYYAVYSGQVTRYYYNNGYTSNTIYRNEFLTSNSEMSSILSTSNTGTTDYTTSNGPGSSTFVGLSSAQDTTAEYNSVSAAANSADTTLYTVYQFVVSFEVGANVSAIGSSSSTCNVTTSDTSCSVVLPSVTPDSGYTSVGWSSTNGDTTGSFDLTLYPLNSNNQTLYANAIIANYLNTNTNRVYTTLVSAFNDVANNQTIQVIQDNVRETSSSTNASDKTGIKFDLNGKTIRLDKIYNYGELDIYNSSSTPATVSSGKYNILDNSGTLTLNGTTHNNSINISNTNATSCSYIVSNTQNLILNDNVTISLTGNEVSCGIIYNSGLFTINGGSITGVTTGIINSAGTINMNNGTISVTRMVAGISNDGTLNVSGGTIDGYTGISSTNNNYNSIVRVTGGTITGRNQGISVGSTTSLTIGTNDGNVDVSSPIIVSNNTQSNYYYGVNADSNSTFNFYDGTIKSASGSGFAISKNPDNIETGYQLHKEIVSSYEHAFLVKPGILMESDNQGSTANYLRTNIAKQDIETITFTNSISGYTANGTTCFDVSRDEDGSVLAWISDSDSDGLYEMTIGAYGKIYASSGYYLFANLYYLDSFDGFQYFDVSNVTNMSYMFRYTALYSSSFTLDLGDSFDTSNVTDMSYMFQSIAGRNTSFTLDLGDNFDTSNVTDMSYMFESAGSDSTIFTLDLGDKFDTSKVTNMYSMFYFTGNKSTAFTLDLGDKFDTSNVTKMPAMFANAGKSSPIFTLDLGDKFDTSNVTNMLSMFLGTGYSSTVFTLDLGDKFDTSNVTDMHQMFENAGYSNTSFTLDLGDKFDTSKVTNMNKMFKNAGYSSTVFTLDLRDKFDTSNVTEMNEMFTYVGYNNTNFTLNLKDKFNTSKVTNMSSMFNSSRYLKAIYVVNDFDTSRVNYSTNMFTGCTSLVGMRGTAYNASNPKDKTYAHIDGGTSNPGYFTKIGGTLATGNTGQTTFYNTSPINKSDVESITLQPYLGSPSGLIGSWDASLNLDNSVIAYYTDTDSNGKYEVIIASDGVIVAPTNSSHLFRNFQNATQMNNLKYLYTRNVTNMEYIFYVSNKLTTLDLSGWDTSNVQNMGYMFYNCNKLETIDFSNWNTSSATTMSSMFNACYNLQSLDLSSFDTSNVIGMQAMFYNCKVLTSINLSSFDTSKVRRIDSMFEGCLILSSLDIKHFDTSSATSMRRMFSNCQALQTIDISSFNTSNVTNMDEMFNNCYALITIYSGSNFDTSGVTTSTNMFKDCSLLVGGNGTTFNSSFIDKTYAHIDEGTSNPGYFTQAPRSIGNGIQNGVNSLLDLING